MKRSESTNLIVWKKRRWIRRKRRRLNRSTERSRRSPPYLTGWGGFSRQYYNVRHILIL